MPAGTLAGVPVFPIIMFFPSSVQGAPFVRSALCAGVAAACLFGAVSTFASTVEPVESLETIVVTATRMPTAASRVLGDITVITSQEIERHGYGDLATILSQEGGLEFDRNGGPGTATGVFTRGAPSRFTAVLIDGVRVDSQNLQGGAPWANLPVGAIERIEIVKGPASALYGSNAVAGVVQIFTKQGKGAPVLDLGVGFASRGVHRMSAGIVGGVDQWDYAFSGSAESGGNQSAITKPSNSDYNSDSDPYKNAGWRAKLGWQPVKGHRVEVTGVHQKSEAHYDDGATPVISPRTRQTLDTAGANWVAEWLPSFDASYSLSQSREKTEGVADWAYATTTDVQVLTAQHRWKVDQRQSVQAILEHREDRLFNADELPGGKGRRSQDAGSIAYDWHGERASAQFKVRQDTDSDFGGVATGVMAAAFKVDADWRVHTSFGTGFRAPTLYERLNLWGGNTALVPEKSRTSEVGTDYRIGTVAASATYFDSVISNLIDWDSGYVNVGRAQLRGLSLNLSDESGAVRWRATADLQSAKNDLTDKYLVRRARERVAFQAETDLMGWTLGGRVRGVGKRFDDQANQQKLGGYALFDGWAQRKLATNCTLLVRLDNAFDHHYELAKDYSVPLRTLFVGIRWTPSL